MLGGLGHSRRTVMTAALLALVLLVAVGCGGEDTAGDDRPLVVTTMPVIYSLTANVAGEAVRLENLLDPGASPHQVSFDPGQARLVNEADLLIMNGAGLEPWANDLMASAGNPDLRLLEASQGVNFLNPSEPIPVLDEDEHDEGEGTDAAEDDHGHAEGVDPHVWLDVGRAQQMVVNIRNALVELDPANEEQYRNRARTYLNTLEALDQDISGMVSGLPDQQFVSFHSAFQYYAQAYGLEQVAVISEFPGQEPSPQYLAELVELIRRLDVAAVFTEPQFSSRPAETLAREAGVETYEVDPQGADLSLEGYERLMRDNTSVFVEALGGDE